SPYRFTFITCRMTPPGTSSPRRIVPPMLDSFEPPWPPSTPVPKRSLDMDHHIVAEPSAVHRANGCPWVRARPSGMRIAVAYVGVTPSELLARGPWPTH